MRQTKYEWLLEQLTQKRGDACMDWPWGTANGYGQVRRRGAHLATHRVAYELVVGPVEAGFQIDHLCRNKLCFNPTHLEQVTPQVNTLRGQSIQARNARKICCSAGHPYDDSNTYFTAKGRACRLCQKEWQRQYRARQEGLVDQ